MVETIRFEIDPLRLTFDELIEIEEGTSMKRTKIIMGRFLMNGSGKPVKEPVAMKRLGKMNLVELTQAITAFVQAAESLASVIVPEAPGEN